MTVERLTWNPVRNDVPHVSPTRCRECGLVKREHINDLYCPEWRLRQLDGDR